MSELTLTVLQLGFVVLLWVFVLGIVGVLRRDLFGTRVVARRSQRRTAERAQRQPAEPPASRTPPAPPPPPRAAASLVVTEGSLRGTTLKLGQAPVLIGRAPESTLVLTDDYASGRHARLFPRDGRWFVEDLGSTNGTELAGSPVTGAVPLEPGAPLRIGRTVLELRR